MRADRTCTLAKGGALGKVFTASEMEIGNTVGCDKISGGLTDSWVGVFV